jgi:hypothetical protein
LGSSASSGLLSGQLSLVRGQLVGLDLEDVQPDLFHLDGLGVRDAGLYVAQIGG